MIKISNWNVAAYLRLSKEDNEIMESNKIDTLTRDILLKNVDSIIISQDGKVNIKFK